MNWINISEIDTHEEIEGKNILVWLKNLADSETHMKTIVLIKIS